MSTQTDVQEHPILFQGDMVRAILDGLKTQTRRVVGREFNHDPNGAFSAKWYIRRSKNGTWDSYETQAALIHEHCPYGRPGDHLWVRESFRLPVSKEDVSPLSYLVACEKDDITPCVQYEADGEEQNRGIQHLKWGRLRPSIHMPRVLSRLTLEVTDVHVERLQAITWDDVDAEGTGIGSGWGWVADWADLWDSINADRGYPWEANPWVWVVSFKRVERKA